ncbi:MAG TPA: 3-hydroxyacyl-CoA dehydrogenase NAD-binding domain-containing protein, partial [Candidatus Limnocylindrales bacterium]|nr:3-hydroxyacyl-CoA dehydrogenase NAD-binding domain-containing protein [Candidatus Limnocylindrales bacterium]
MAEVVEYQRRGSIGVITVNNPPVNALSAAVRRGLQTALQQGLSDDGARALVLVGGGRTFIAGADIREFGQPSQPPDLNSVIASYEASPKLVVVAIHGTALGGGLEVALGCHYRGAAASAQVGFPEVKLGLLPGAGGTQRLPRLIGVEPALSMIVSGDPVRAPRALEIGIVDAVVEGDLLAGAVAFAERLVAEGAPLRKIAEMQDKVENVPPTVFEAFRKSIERTARGYLAPAKCIESVQAATTLPFAQGLARERALFTECLGSPQSRGQIHVFFSEREVAKIPGIGKETAARPIRSAAVVGAGTMGGGIAMSFANAGIPVRVLEVSADALVRGLGIVRKNHAATVERGRLTQADMDRRMGLIQGVGSYEEIADADIIVEAVFEEMAVKEEVFARLDKTAKPEAILASNTSTLDIDRMARATARPGQVIGTHFFSPANVMRLLEIVRGAATSKETIATAMELARTIRKVGVLVGNCDSFVGNRMLHGYLREAEFLVEEGALPHQVDRVIYEFGLPMGPFAMGDMAGLDVGWRIRKGKAAARPRDERYSPMADRICEMGRFGQKTSAGWYRYEKGDRTPRPDPEIEALVAATSKELGIPRRTISDDEILKRCLYPLVNEGARILEEGIALRASDIDIIYVYGYGFPPYRGGPMFHADQVGLDRVHADIAAFHKIHGKPWEPAPLLTKLATGGKQF